MRWPNSCLLEKSYRKFEDDVLRGAASLLIIERLLSILIEIMDFEKMVVISTI